MTSSSRGTKARLSLIGAAGRVVSEKGLGGVRIRDIAAEAGVSPAAVLYHYPETDALMLDVHRAAVDEYVEARRAEQQRSFDPRHRLVSAVIAGVPPYTDPGVIKQLYEMHGLARRSSEHAELMSSLWRREHSQYVQVIEDGIRLGYFAPTRKPAEVARMLLSMEDGLVLHLVSENKHLNPDKVIDTFIHFAEDILHCSGLVRLSRRLIKDRADAEHEDA
ncbi:TetR/AcrR family transcriptional regulator [Paenarthrobacter histidinolovorans]|uniref:TetR/AcrR family transcriptional regulator n=1 Tax=Paenarthrobacter histidinolovorans TaxID=43664 RepID=UPI001664D6EA|nr:TetR family transcriptional regulator C-terminal domain-containing protein [Paenarthrobacter histidinolovorans]